MSVDPTQVGSLSQLLFEVAPDAMVAIGANGKIKMVNQQAERLFGYSREEMLGQFVETLIPERYRQRHVFHRDGYFAYPRIRPMGLGLNLYALTKSGDEIPVEISLAPVSDSLAVATIRDITAWRRIVEPRGESQRMLPLEAQWAAVVGITILLLALFTLSIYFHWGRFP